MPFGLDADILEEAGGVERTNRFRDFLGIDMFSHLDREIGKDRAGFSPLQALDPDILDHKGTEMTHFLMLGLGNHRSCRHPPEQRDQQYG